MADEHDYTKMWSGTFTPPRIGDDDRGIYLLDDEISVGRDPDDDDFTIPDRCTRSLYETAHPRSYPGGQRYPGPYGGGRASDRVGPTPAERKLARMREGFSGGSADRCISREDRDLYTQGSRRLGHPGPRGMVTSSREGRPAIDGVVWDNRPPHYAPDTANEDAHLYVDEDARGPALFSKDTTYPGFRQVDHFAGAAPTGLSQTTAVEIIKIIVVVISLILVAMWLAMNQTVRSLEKRMDWKIDQALSRLGRRDSEPRSSEL